MEQENGDGGGGGGSGWTQQSSLRIPSRKPMLLVMHDFQARTPDELSLRKGEIVELLQDDAEFNDGWYTGRCQRTDKTGLFPQVYTKPLPNDLLTPIVEVNHTDNEGDGVGADGDDTPHVSQRSSLRSLKDAAGLSEKNHQEEDTGAITDIEAGGKTDDEYSTDVERTPAPLSAAKNQDAQTPDTPPLTVTKSPPAAASGSNFYENTAVASPSNSAIARVESPSPSPSRSGADQEQRSSAMYGSMRSPVVEECMSDIDEAISSISRNSRDSKMLKNQYQRQSRDRTSDKQLPVQQEIVQPDSASEYSRQSIYDDTDSGDDHIVDPSAGLTTEDVRQWSTVQVSDYLQACGISADLASKFEEEEVTGSILLQLEMSHLKDIGVGSFGKRFEVWKVIEDLHKRLKEQAAISSRHNSNASRTSQIPGLAISAQRSSTVGTPSSGASLRSGKPGHSIDVKEANKKMNGQQQWFLHTPHHTGVSGDSNIPPTPFERPRSPPMSPPKMSMDSRHSTSSKRLSNTETWSAATGLNAALMTGTAVLHAGMDERHTHLRQSSFDREYWPGPIQRPSTATGVRTTSATGHRPSASATTEDSGYYGNTGSMRLSEKSYFSGGEGAGRERKVLQKKGHQRKSSYTEEQRFRSASHSRHSRVNSREDNMVATIRESRNSGSSHLPPTSILSNAANAIKETVTKRKSNSFSSPPTEQYIFTSPKLSPTAPQTAPFSTGPKNTLGDTTVAQEIEGMRSAGLPQRSVSGSTGKDYLPTPTSLKEVKFGSESTVSTPSISTTGDSDPPRPKGIDDIDEDEISEKAKRLRNANSTSGLRGKKKHQTSAWLEGLKNITPREAAADADFSGWMQKRGSGAIAATWKPRFFVLKGKRLSYFYSLDDTRERGLIDITSHRVCPASEDRLINMSAQLAAATSPAHTPRMASPSIPGTPTSAATPATPTDGTTTEKSGKPKKEAWFTFKLVPPQPGTQRGVTFTPPRLHYFATATRAQGKEWMAALLKATIERDETKPVVSSFSAKTISLKKAREMRTRPPELSKDDKDEDGNPTQQQGGDRFGLGLAIEGLNGSGELGTNISENEEKGGG